MAWSVYGHGSYFTGCADPHDLDLLLVGPRLPEAGRRKAARVVFDLLRGTPRGEEVTAAADRLLLDVDNVDSRWLDVIDRAVLQYGTRLAGPPVDFEPVTAEEWCRYLLRHANAVAASQPGSAVLSLIRALWASEGRVVLPKSAVVAEAAGGPWEDLATVAWHARHAPTLGTHPDLADLIAQASALPTTTPTLEHDGGKAIELADSGVTWLPGQHQAWLPEVRPDEQPSALFTWWEPPHPRALRPDECDALLEYRHTPRPGRDAPWRCDAWVSEPPTVIADRVVGLLTDANTLWWRLDLTDFHLSVHRYTTGQAHPEHFDMVPGTMTRKLAASIQLSDPDTYDGGDLELYIGGTWHTAPRTRGTAVTIPGWIPHRVQPVTRGERYSLVVMAYGPPIR